tara:strand:- start:1312 stop:1575 length:264 start_codon:yes stop_codon:yes gene_type:complete
VIHNIYLVFLGMIIALLEIYKKSINKFITYISNKIFSKATNGEDSILNQNTISKDSNNQDSSISLVEKIEESGYIPSIEKDDEIDAA